MANEDIVWSVDFGDIDVAAVEAEVREQAERKNPQQALERKYAERKAAEAAEAAEEDRRAREAKERENERNCITRIENTQEFRITGQEAEELRKIADVARFEAEKIVAEAKQEADRIKADVERRQFEEEKRKLKHDEERSSFEADRKSQEAELQVARATDKATLDQQARPSSQSLPKASGGNVESPPWGTGLGQSPQKTHESGIMISSIFANADLASAKALPPTENPPPPPKSPAPKKPLLGSAFGGQ